MSSEKAIANEENTENLQSNPQQQQQQQSEESSKTAVKVDAKKQAKLERMKQKEESEKKSKHYEESHVSFEDVETGKTFFGTLPRIQSTFINKVQYSHVEHITKELSNQIVTLRCRVQHSREKGKGIFLVLREGGFSIQGVAFQVKDKEHSKDLVKYISHLSKESIVDVVGVVTIVKEPVQYCTQKDVELQVEKIFCIVSAIPQLPLLVDDAMLPEEDEGTVPVINEEKNKEEGHHQHHEGETRKAVSRDVRLDYRVLDMRAPANLAIFKIQSGVGYFFREYLTSQNFVEIHTPKLIATASEGGADVFEVKYFQGKAYLAQSPQLYKQMAVQGDLMRVFEIGPVFRAEKAFTHRHMTEFVGCDFEMVIDSHYYEILDVVDALFIHIFDGIQTKFKKELEIISQQYPFQPLIYERQKKNLRLTYAEAMQLLRDDGAQIGDYEDIGTTLEKQLGKIIKAKYNTEFYIVDKYPLVCRPFYTMPCSQNPKLSNSYDVFLRGEEISSGAQRIHEADLLIQRAKDLSLNLTPIQAYVDCFKYGAFPHGGAGIGLERVVMLFLGLHNIRKTSMFPRDPKRLTP